MTDRPKAKSGKTRNDTRRNGKAFKKGTARGSKPTRLSPVEKVLLGGGRNVVFNGVGSDPRTQNTGGKGR